MASLKKNNKILVVSQHFWPETFRINDICEYLVDHGYNVDVLCGIPNYPSGNFFKGYGYTKNRKQVHKKITIRRVFEIPRLNNTSIMIFLNYVSFPLASLLHIPRMLFKKYDKILLYQTSPVMMTVSGIMLGRLKNIETTMYVLDLWPENLYSVLPIRNTFFRKLLEKISTWHYRHVDKLAVLSETMKNELIARTDVSHNKIIVLPQAPEEIHRQKVNDESLKDRFGDSFNLVFTGSITPAQSFDTIVKAATILKDSGIDDINWIIVGDGMSRKKVENDVRIAGLGDSFHFEGQKPLEDIPKYTSIANGLVGCLVRSDLISATIPAKVMSYIAAGKPIVLSMDGEVQALINKTIRGGFAGDAENVTELVKNITKLRNLSEKEYTSMVNRLDAYYQNHLNRDIIFDKLISFIYK